MDAPVVSQITDTVHHVEGPAANWTILTDRAPGPGVAFTLVDAGYPGYAPMVAGSVRSLGLRPRDLAAVLVTHAHVDHVGGLPSLLRNRPEVPVLAGQPELPLLRGDAHESATPLDLLRRLHQHEVLPWAMHLLRNGAAAKVTVAQAVGVPGTEALDIPGRPVPVLTPGHTSGHTVYLLPETGVLLTGDALVTAHQLSREVGPQVLRDFFHTDPAAMLDSLEILAAQPAQVVVPGHGPAWHGGADRAAGRAAETATDLLAGRTW